MTLLEYTTTLKVLGIDKTKDWNDLDFEYDKKYYEALDYAIVNGKIPLEVANIIYEKYPDNQYGIRVYGGNHDWNPNEWSKNGYLEKYHIDTMEGLIIFVTEMMDYKSRKDGQQEIEVNKYNDYLKEAKRRVLAAAKPEINGYQWIMKNEQNKDLYLQTLEKMQQDSFSKSLRSLIEKFDKAINPFEEEVSDEEKERLLERVMISGSIYDDREIKSIKGAVPGTVYISRCPIEYNFYKDCADIYYMDIETNSYTFYSRDKNGFYYTLTCSPNENEEFEVIHAFSKKEDEDEKGEWLYITRDEYGQEGDYIAYSLTNDVIVIGSINGAKTPATAEQKMYVYEQLEKAISYASEITLDKMKKSLVLSDVSKKS